MDKLNHLKLLREACLLLLMYCLIINTFCNGKRKQETGTGYNARFNRYNRRTVKVDGSWGYWAGWSACAGSCGSGSRVRVRQCTNPAPSAGGAGCVGDQAQASGCDIQGCTVDGRWTGWNGWSVCAGTCGSGIRVRVRQCTDPAPSAGGAGCLGDQAQASVCELHNCPVHGIWVDWTEWSMCSTTLCNLGMRQRTRTCTCPPPSAGGDYCVGEPNEIEPCSKRRFCGRLLIGPCNTGVNFMPNPPNTTFGSKITVTCGEGFVPVASEVTCRTDSQWDNFIKCDPIP